MYFEQINNWHVFVISKMMHVSKLMENHNFPQSPTHVRIYKKYLRVYVPRLLRAINWLKVAWMLVTTNDNCLIVEAPLYAKHNEKIKTKWNEANNHSRKNLWLVCLKRVISILTLTKENSKLVLCWWTTFVLK